MNIQSSEIQSSENQLLEDQLPEDQSSERLVIQIKYPEIFRMFKLAEQLQWTDDEIKLNDDRDHWETLDTDERQFISYILAFFAVSDGIVSENLALRFYQDVVIPEARLFYSFQLYIEAVHSIVYSKIIETLISNITEQKRIFNAINTIPAVRTKAGWVLKWIQSNQSFDVRLIAFIIVEGLFFSGSFSAIYWLRAHHKGKFPGLIQANELIMRDEGIHQDFGILMYKTLKCNVPINIVDEIFNDAVNVEIQFMQAALMVDLNGMNINLMTMFIKYMANRLREQLGFPPLYEGVVQPFPFMDNISISTVADFFGPSRPTEYNKGGKAKSNFNVNYDPDCDF